MSTKVTVEYKNADDDTDFHLYLECMEPDAIYLQLGKPQWEFDGQRVTVRLPREVFEKIANGKHFDTLKRHSESIKDWENEEHENLFLKRLQGQSVDSGEQEGEQESSSEE